MIRTTSKTQNGHYRAGVFHSPKRSEWPDDLFTEEQLAQLEADPRLVIEHVDGEPGGQPEGADQSGEDAEYLERKSNLDDRERALVQREKDVAAKETVIAELKADPGLRKAVLAEAIRRVVEGKVKGDLTQDGRPQTAAVGREAFIFDINAKERDELFAELYPPEKG